MIWLWLRLRLHQVEDMVNDIKELKSTISATEEFVRTTLDGRRNSLIRTELLMTMATVSIGVGGTVGAAFGMNLTRLDSGKEERGGGQPGQKWWWRYRRVVDRMVK